MQFRWNLQLLTLYSLFRNLPCSTSNLLVVDADRTFVALNIFCVSLTIALYILNVFWQDRVYYWSFSKIILFIVRCFFLLIHFSVVEDYELPKSTSHIPSVPLNLECSRILSWSTFFSSILIVFLMMFCARFLSEPMIIWSQLIMWLTMWLTMWLVATSCNLNLKMWKCNTRDIGKCNTAFNYILIFRKLFFIYKVTHIDLKPRILTATFLLAPLLNN